MRSSVALLGLLLASAQAFYVPVNTRSVVSNKQASFMGQTVARPTQARASRANLLRASLEDIERRLMEQEIGKISAARGSKTKGAPVPKAASPAPAPAPAPAKAVARKTVVPAPKAEPAVGETTYLCNISATVSLVAAVVGYGLRDHHRVELCGKSSVHLRSIWS